MLEVWPTVCHCRRKAADVSELENGASIICFSTVPPSFLVTIRQRLDALCKDIGVSRPW